MEGGDELASTIGERIRAIRKTVKLSQTEFGVRLGVGLGVIRNLEAGLTTPSEAQIDLMCNVFTVNPEWLESGRGEMFRDLSREEKIAAFVGEALADETDSFKRDLISLLASLDEAGWQKLRDAAQVVVDAIERQKKEGD